MDLSKVLAPIKALFSNVAFVTSLLTTLGAVVVILVPAFEPYRDIVVKGAIAVILLAAGGNAVAQARVAPINAQVALIYAQASLAHAEAAKAQATAHG